MPLKSGRATGDLRKESQIYNSNWNDVVLHPFRDCLCPYPPNDLSNCPGYKSTVNIYIVSSATLMLHTPSSSSSTILTRRHNILRVNGES